jgi:hypothetical protein
MREKKRRTNTSAASFLQQLLYRPHNPCVFFSATRERLRARTNMQRMHRAQPRVLLCRRLAKRERADHFGWRRGQHDGPTGAGANSAFRVRGRCGRQTRDAFAPRRRGRGGGTSAPFGGRAGSRRCRRSQRRRMTRPRPDLPWYSPSLTAPVRDLPEATLRRRFETGWTATTHGAPEPHSTPSALARSRDCSRWRASPVHSTAHVESLLHWCRRKYSPSWIVELYIERMRVVTCRPSR